MRVSGRSAASPSRSTSRSRNSIARSESIPASISGASMSPSTAYGSTCIAVSHRGPVRSTTGCGAAAAAVVRVTAGLDAKRRSTRDRMMLPLTDVGSGSSAGGCTTSTCRDCTCEYVGM
eukprot:7389353-Prymnesium_polylepis.1